MENIKILIVEDDIDIATMYQAKFEKEWFNVKLVQNWIDAVTEVTKFKPNAILLDIMMPSMDWFETLKVIRELGPSINTKIIMFSNLNKKEDIDKCMAYWADAYLLKANTTPKDAVDKVRDLIFKKDLNETNNIISGLKCPHCWRDINININ